MTLRPDEKVVERWLTWPSWTLRSSPSTARSGRARRTFVFTRTTAGEIGILPRHIPLVAQLVDDAMVRVEREGEDDLRVAVDGGFLSVTDDGRHHSRRVRGVRVGYRRRRRQGGLRSPTTRAIAAQGAARD